MSGFFRAERFNRRRKPVCRGVRGFTLIELMIVMMIISILIGMAAIIYDKTIKRARESVLKQDLQTMRQAIDNYTLDKQQAPQSLDDLVDAHYLREVPLDPVCQQKDWVPHTGDTVLSPDQTSTGVDDVHSGCQQNGSDGTSYTTW
ncbi:MAG TPA: type II secretion system protein [Candidatus Acidoferrales bacterium]|nr:type II secretion system protein [Candidatus Acidoferrales bacterium]